MAADGEVVATNWNLLRKKYPLPEDPTYEQVKQAIRDYFHGKTLKELAEIRQERGDQQDKHDNIVACITAEVTILDELILDGLDKIDMTNVTTNSGVTFRRDSTLDAKVQADGGAEKLRRWLVENEMSDYLKVNGNSLSKLVRDRDERGEGPPPGVDAVPRNKLRVTGRANKDT